MDKRKFASTIPQFCSDHNISRSGYYNLRNQNLAPDEIHLGRKVLITDEAAAEWRLWMTELTANAKAEKEREVAEAARQYEKSEPARQHPKQKRRREAARQAKETRE